MSGIPSAIVGDYGDEIAIDVGENITGWVLLLVNILKPDGSVLAKSSSGDGVTDKGAPTAGVVYYTVQSGVRTIDGIYRYGATVISASSTKSSPLYDEDVVARQNQTIQIG